MQLLERTKEGDFIQLPVPDNIEDFHFHLLNNTITTIQSFQYQQHMEYQRTAEQLSKTRYETEEMRQEIADCEIDLERQHNQFNYLQQLSKTILADIQSIKNIVNQQELDLLCYQIRQQRLSDEIEAFRTHFSDIAVSPVSHCLEPAIQEEDKHMVSCAYSDLYAISVHN